IPASPGTLNPLDQAKAMRLSTELMYSCKDDMIRLNVSPAILKELKRLCIMFRACFAYGSYSNTTIKEFRQTYMHCLRSLIYMGETLSPERTTDANPDAAENNYDGTDNWTPVMRAMARRREKLEKATEDKKSRVAAGS
ncbi:hypothetical protein V5799_022390, partial [Amblyomma americanum]